jgi:hypothetical protein
LNERLAAIDVAEDARHIQGRPTSIGFDFEAERGLLRPLPADDFDCGIDLMPTVARNSRVTVRQGYYSVPPQRLPQAVETGQSALVTSLGNRIRRTQLLGGPINEYQQAA